MGEAGVFDVAYGGHEVVIGVCVVGVGVGGGGDIMWMGGLCNICVLDVGVMWVMWVWMMWPALWTARTILNGFFPYIHSKWLLASEGVSQVITFELFLYLQGYPRYDLTLIEPTHCNKPDITYLKIIWPWLCNKESWDIAYLVSSERILNGKRNAHQFQWEI